MSEILDSAELLAFTQIVDAHSVSRAALELRLPRATIGRRLQRLEERLGVRLLKRTTRSLVLTDAGESLYRQARIALDAIREAEASVRRTDAAVRGELRISVPPFTTLSFHALIDDFALRYPEVRVQLHFSTRHVDLRSAGYDVAIRGASVFEPGLVARTLVRGRMIVVASPAYLARSGPLRSPRDLRHHHCLLSFARGELPESHWIDRKGRKVQVQGKLASNDIAMLGQAAVDGLGIAYLPHMQVRSALESGALVRVLADSFERETRLSIVFLEREFLPPQVRAFIDAVTAWAEREGETGLWPRPPVPRGPAASARPSRTRPRGRR